MAFILIIKPKARKNLDNLPEPYRIKVIKTLRDICENPFSSKKLSGKRRDQYSVRVWPYRIIYLIEKRELLVIVIDIDHRQGVYKD